MSSPELPIAFSFPDHFKHTLPMATLDLSFAKMKGNVSLWTWNPQASQCHLKLLSPVKGSSSVYFGRLDITGGARNTYVVAKLAATPTRHKELCNEFDFYDNELRGLQGDVVPVCYGFYTGRNDRLGDLSVMILEYCPCIVRHPSPEYGRQVLLAASKLHAIGVVHTQIDDHHILAQKSSNQIRIIDFSLARRHKCAGAYPALYDKSSEFLPQCWELELLERLYGSLDVGSPVKPVVTRPAPTTWNLGVAALLSSLFG